MKNNKIIVSILMVIFILSNFFVTVFASSDDIEIGESGKPAILISSSEGNPGEEVTLTLSLKNNPGISNMKIGLEYDERLEVVSVDDKGLLDGFSVADDLSSPLSIEWKSEKNISENGNIATITFKIPKDSSIDDEYKMHLLYYPKDITNDKGVQQYFEAGYAQIDVKGDSAALNNENNDSQEGSSNIVVMKSVIIFLVVIVVILAAVLVLILIKLKKREK